MAISVAPRHSVDLRATAKGGQTIGEVKASGPEGSRARTEGVRFCEAAIKFFSEEGFDGSTHNFAKKIGITQPLIYRYFDLKDQLIREVYNAVFEGRWKSEWEATLRDRTKSITTRLHEFYVVYTDVVFARDWMRIDLFSGLRELDINRWWISFVESRILSTICDELRYETGADSVLVRAPTPQEMELMWSFQGSLFTTRCAETYIARESIWIFGHSCF